MPYSISLDDERAAFARDLGRGSLTEGVRRALDIIAGDDHLYARRVYRMLEDIRSDIAALSQDIEQVAFVPVQALEPTAQEKPDIDKKIIEDGLDTENADDEVFSVPLGADDDGEPVSTADILGFDVTCPMCGAAGFRGSEGWHAAEKWRLDLCDSCLCLIRMDEKEVSQ